MRRLNAIFGRPLSPKLGAVFVLLLLVGGETGCSAISKKFQRRPPKAQAAADAKPTPAAPRLVGEVVVVNEEEHFVLIDTGLAPAPEGGLMLKTMTAGVESGSVKVSTVSRHPFVIADIATGTPRKGDQVFQ